MLKSQYHDFFLFGDNLPELLFNPFSIISNEKVICHKEAPWAFKNPNTNSQQPWSWFPIPETHFSRLQFPNF